MSEGGRKVDTRTTDPVGAPRARESAPDPLAETRPADSEELQPGRGLSDDGAFDTDRIAPSLPTALFERYKIKRKLGSGGMGVVYEAMDLNLHRVIALKVLKLVDEDPSQLAEAANRLVREARAMAVLSHKNVVTVYDVGMHGMQVYVAMQLVDGVTLRHWLAATTRSTSDILRVLREAGNGLAAAHRARLVHRDFKPDNVLVSKRGSVRVTDFGLARRANFETQEDSSVHERTSRPKVLDVHSVENVTQSGAILGTPAYMPPEQSEGRVVDARADQFSFCVAAWEALYGVRPFSGTTWSQLYSNVISGTINEPDQKKRVPRPIQKALRKGLSVDPANRFATMDELLAILATGIKRPNRILRFGVLPLGSAAVAGLVTAMVLKQDPTPPPATSPGVVRVTPSPAPISSEPIAAPTPPVAVATPDPVPTTPEAKPTPKTDPKRDPKKKITKDEAVTPTPPAETTRTAPPVETPTIDPLAQVKGQRRELESRARKRGLLPGDLPAAATSATHELDAAIPAGQARTAEAAIAAAHKAIDGVVINGPFINAKLVRINRQVAGREEELRPLLAKLQTHVKNQAFGEANALLNDIASRFAK